MSRFAWIACALALAGVPLSCGGGGARRAAITWWVDGGAGSDSNSGSTAAPFRTITHALSIVQVGENISVRPWTYDTAHGETFPLVVPPSVRLVGDIDTAGQGARGPPTRIVGAGDSGLQPPGTTTLRALAGCRIAGFSITNPTPSEDSFDAIGIFVRSANVEIDACTIRDCSDAIRYWRHETTSAAPSGCIVRRCNVLDNGIGLAADVFDGTAVRVQESLFQGNRTGAITDGPDVDLGGGSQGSTGGNTFRCNELHIATHGQAIADFEVAPYALSARGNSWDPSPPLLTPLPLTGITPETGEIGYLQGVTLLLDPILTAPACP
jgi:hypothetical protein